MNWRMIICWIVGLWNSLSYFIPMSGHLFVEVDDDTIGQTLKCTVCGTESIGFRGKVKRGL